MANVSSLSPVPGVPGYTGTISPSPVVQPDEKKDTPQAVFTGDVYTLLEYDQGTPSNTLGLNGALDFGWGKLTGQIEYTYPGLFPTDEASGSVDGKNFTVKRINSSTYKVSGTGFTETTISSAADIESLSLSTSEKKLIRSLFYQVFATELSPAGKIKGNLTLSALDDVLRFRLGVLPMPRPEVDAGLNMLGITQPDENLGAEISLGASDLRVGWGLMFSGVNPTDPYAVGLDNYKSSLNVGGSLKALGLPQMTIYNAINIGKFPEVGNVANPTVIYSQEQLNINYDFVDIFGKASHLIVGGEFSVEDYRYKDTQKLLDTIGGALNVSGIIPIVRQEDRNIFSFNFSLRGSYQNAKQYDATATSDTFGEVIATTDDWDIQGALGLTWSPSKPLTFGLYVGGSGLFETASREQPDILNGGTYTVDESFNKGNFFIGLYATYSLGDGLPTKKEPVKEEAPVAEPAK